MSEAHLDISEPVLLGLLLGGSEHHFSVDPGLPSHARIDDVTWDPIQQRLRIHFDCRIGEQPLLHSLGCRNRTRLDLV